MTKAEMNFIFNMTNTNKKKQQFLQGLMMEFATTNNKCHVIIIYPKSRLKMFHVSQRDSGE